MDYLANIQHNDLQLSKLPIVVNVDAIDPVAYPNRSQLRYYLQVFAPEFYQGSFVQLTTLEASEEPPVTLAGITTYPGANFEIQDQLHGLVESTMPDFGLSQIALCQTLVRPYYTKSIRKIANTLLDEAIRPAGYVYCGGFDEEDYSVYKNNFFTQFVGANRSFLTWKPNPAMLRHNQPEYLGFLTNFTPTPLELRLRVQATYEDNTTEIYTALSLSGISSMSVYICPVGPAVLGLLTKPKVVTRYRVWLSNQNNERLSEVRTYIIDTTPARKVRYILFQNSFGVFDTLACVGNGSENLRVSRQTAERYRGDEYLPTLSEKVINRISGERELTVAVGYAKYNGSQLRDYWQELYFAEQIYLVSDRSHLPLTLLNDAYLADDDDEKLVGRTLTFRYANPQSSYSRLPVAVTQPTRPTGWRGDAAACELNQATGLRNGKKSYRLLVKYYLDTGEDFNPRTQKPNVIGTEGYIPPWASSDCSAATTPYRNTAISQASVFKRNNCTGGKVGSGWTITVAANSYGSELSAEDAQDKAQKAANLQDTQANANLRGACIIPSPIPLGITNACPDSSLNPVFAVLLNGEEPITNTSFNAPEVRYADTGIAAGVYNIDVRVAYGAAPFAPFRLRIPSKGFVSESLTGNQTYRIANITVNWGDPDLIIIGELL